MPIAPLEDPRYEPIHQPTNGAIPAVVAKWGPKSQIRWFNRFRATIRQQRDALTAGERQARPLHLDQYYCDSEYHLGPCCYSCSEEASYGTGVRYDGWCCCHDQRMGNS
jgi:hypothetical protein